MKQLPVYSIDEFVRESVAPYFYSNTLRAHLESHKFVNSPHKHDFYLSILFTTGHGVHEIDFNSYKVAPGALFLLNPGQVHCWKLSLDAEGWVFFHTKDFYDTIFINKKLDDYPFFYLKQNHPVVYLDSTQIDKFRSYFYEINQEYYLRLESKENKIGILTDLIYIEVQRLYYHQSAFVEDKNQHFNKIQKLQKLIEENFRTKKFPKDYAELMNMSPRHLNRICQEALGKSTSTIIIERIILEAKRMLIHSDYMVSYVASELGYFDYSYFIRLFKKTTGVSPKEFQRGITFPG